MASSEPLKMNVVGDRDVCVGSGTCAMVSPELFSQDEVDGRFIVLKQPADAQSEEAARMAVQLCPTGALSLVDEG